ILGQRRPSPAHAWDPPAAAATAAPSPSYSSTHTGCRADVLHAAHERAHPSDGPRSARDVASGNSPTSPVTENAAAATGGRRAPPERQQFLDGEPEEREHDARTEPADQVDDAARRQREPARGARLHHDALDNFAAQSARGHAPRQPAPAPRL